MSRRSKYTHDDRKNIVDLIQNLKNADDYMSILEILMKDDDNIYISNTKGVFLNLSCVSDKTMSSIVKYLNKISKPKANEIKLDVDIIPTSNSSTEKAYRRSNYEKTILRQKNLKREESSVASKKDKSNKNAQKVDN